MPNCLIWLEKKCSRFSPRPRFAAWFAVFNRLPRQMQSMTAPFFDSGIVERAGAGHVGVTVAPFGEALEVSLSRTRNRLTVRWIVAAFLANCRERPSHVLSARK